MQISCDCGAFKAELQAFPKNTPGRLACYCNDCQAYLNKIERTDVLDEYGGSEIIPVYPGEVKILQGKESLKCYKLTEKGLYRWTAGCCNTPIVNTPPGFPWAGIFHTAYKNSDPSSLDSLGKIKSRIFGKYAKGQPPFEIADKMGFKALLTVMPFVIKGKILKKAEGSEFFESDGRTPIAVPEILEEGSASQSA